MTKRLTPVMFCLCLLGCLAPADEEMRVSVSEPQAIGLDDLEPLEEIEWNADTALQPDDLPGAVWCCKPSSCDDGTDGHYCVWQKGVTVCKNGWVKYNCPGTEDFSCRECTPAGSTPS